MSGIGGRLQAIWQLPDGTIRGIDATTQVPASYVKRPKEDENGYGTIGVPGMVKGIVGMHGLHGRLPLRTVMRPAIEAASKGHPMHADESRRQSLELKELRKYPATARHFLPKDTVPAAGASFRQPALASTLKMIAKDRGRSFYGGSIGYALAKEVGEGGGFLTIADMEAYRAPDARVLRGAYRGYEIVGMGLPCYGAIVIEMLQMLEQADLSNCSEADFLLHHASVHYKAYDDRPLLRTIEDSLVRPSYARRRWADTVPASIRAAGQADTADHANGHTTHLVACDREGNVVSLTQSLGPLMGSKVASARYGFLLATTMGPYLGGMKAGERASSHISPILVLKDGRPVMALGAAGGARIVPAIVQVISRVIDQGMPIGTALAAGRVYQMPDRLLLEEHGGVTWKDSRTPARIRASVRKVEAVRGPAQFGRVHALVRLADGRWVGAADPDWSGTAAGPE